MGFHLAIQCHTQHNPLSLSSSSVAVNLLCKHTQRLRPCPCSRVNRRLTLDSSSGAWWFSQDRFRIRWRIKRTLAGHRREVRELRFRFTHYSMGMWNWGGMGWHDDVHDVVWGDEVKAAAEEGDRNAIECCCVTISLNSIYIMWTNGRRLHYTTQWTRLVSGIVHLFVIRKERKWVDEDATWNKDDGRDDVYYYGSCFVPLKAGKFDRSKCVANVVFSSLSKLSRKSNSRTCSYIWLQDRNWDVDKPRSMVVVVGWIHICRVH